MKNFSDLGIAPKSRRFVGKKIEMSEIIDEDIVVHSFRIEPSQYPNKRSDMVTKMQIELDGRKRVTWTTSKYLTQMLEAVPEDAFPIQTKIIKDEKAFIFT